MAWRIAGTYVASCSCSLICPCPTDGPPTGPDGTCTGCAVFQIGEGSFDAVDLSGTAFAFYNLFPSNLTAGDWKMGVVVDEGASDEQARAIERILSGQEGGIFADLAPLIGDYLGTERGAITFSGGDTPSATVAGRTEIRFEPLQGVDGRPTTVRKRDVRLRARVPHRPRAGSLGCVRPDLRAGVRGERGLRVRVRGRRGRSRASMS